jgi:hypothetical protein
MFVALRRVGACSLVGVVVHLGLHLTVNVCACFGLAGGSYVTQKTRDYFKELDRKAKAGHAKDASSEAQEAEAAAAAVSPRQLRRWLSPIPHMCPCARGG